jgi:hypothetical protein
MRNSHAGLARLVANLYKDNKSTDYKKNVQCVELFCTWHPNDGTLKHCLV